MKKMLILSIFLIFLLLSVSFSVSAKPEYKASNVAGIAEKRVTFVKNKNKALSDQLKEFKDMNNALNEAEEKLDRETYTKASSRLETLNFVLLKSHFKSRLNVIDQELVTMEKEKERIKKEKEKRKKQLVATQQKEDNSQTKDKHKEEKNNATKKENPNTSNSNSKKTEKVEEKEETAPEKKEQQSNTSKDTKDWDAIGDYAENKEWEQIGSGEIGGSGEGQGNTWNSYK
ncbi:hypothetical protein [Paraliobacillus ryukyuensis]|uniref:hypothetical protein n=1 Tax=Paraliobacillus ryukyuensis TaxID=200904 RepID=UPI0009A6A5C1|nr:hypothetical protein [Paraliobacillus ryukyuensis]